MKRLDADEMTCFVKIWVVLCLVGSAALMIVSAIG